MKEHIYTLHRAGLEKPCRRPWIHSRRNEAAGLIIDEAVAEDQEITKAHKEP
jgi:hypothetical protein